MSAFAAMTMLASNAQAKVFVPSILPAASMGLIENTCDSKIQSASLLSPEVAPVAAPQSKMTAILGGEMSALEMMRAQQANPSPKVAAAATPVATPAIATLSPAAGGVRQPITISCLSASARAPDQIAEPVQAVQLKQLVHTPEGSMFGIELVGTSEFDPADSDWACSEVWEPSHGRNIGIPVSFCTGDWQLCLSEMTRLIVAISTTNARLGFILKSVEGVGIGFVDGDLSLIEFGQ